MRKHVCNLLCIVDYRQLFLHFFSRACHVTLYTVFLHRYTRNWFDTLVSMYLNWLLFITHHLILQQDSTLPATVSLLVMLSRDVFEVRRVFLLLTAPGSPCCLMRVVELFYCLATFFYKHWRQQVLPQR